MVSVATDVDRLPAEPLPAVRASSQRHAFELGFLVLFAAFVMYLVLPLIGMLLFSIGDDWVETVVPRRFTPEYWVNAISHPLFFPTITRSLLASFGTMALSIALMTPTLFVLHVAAPRLRPFVEFVSLAPFALPTVVFALSLIRTYSVPPLVITGTPLILILSYTVLSLPFVYRAIDNSLRALDTRTLYEAAQTLGAPRWEPFFSIVIPNITRGLVAASLLVLSVTFGEYTMSAFLVGDAWKTSGVWMYTFWDDNPHEALALGVISFAITWGASLTILALFGRRTPGEVGRA